MLTSFPKGRIIVVYLGDKDMMFSSSEYNVPEEFRFAKRELDKVVQIMRLLDCCSDKFLRGQFEIMSTHHLHAVDKFEYDRLWSNREGEYDTWKLLEMSDFPREVILESIARNMIRSYEYKAKYDAYAETLVAFLTRCKVQEPTWRVA